MKLGKDRIILALDNMTTDESLEMANKLAGKPGLWGAKVNNLLDVNGVGIVERLIQIDGIKNVMSDPKIGDTGNTMKNRSSVYVEAKSTFVTIHAIAGPEAMAEVVEVCKGTNTIPVAVTLLTSITKQRCIELFRRKPQNVVKLLAQWAADVGFEWVVCSAKELNIISGLSLHKIVAGTRPIWYQKLGGQAGDRSVTPEVAMKEGADLLVGGRAITTAENPAEALMKFDNEIQNALA